MAVSNDAVRSEDRRMIGDPTEVALYLAAETSGHRKAELLRQLPRVAELPFDSDRKCMTTFHRHDSEVIAFTKGAPEQVVALCETVLVITSYSIHYTKLYDGAAISVEREEALGKCRGTAVLVEQREVRHSQHRQPSCLSVACPIIDRITSYNVCYTKLLR